MIRIYSPLITIFIFWIWYLKRLIPNKDFSLWIEISVDQNFGLAELASKFCQQKFGEKKMLKIYKESFLSTTTTTTVVIVNLQIILHKKGD